MHGCVHEGHMYAAYYNSGGRCAPQKGSKRLSLVSPSMMTFIVRGLVIYGNVFSLIARQVVSYKIQGYSSKWPRKVDFFALYGLHVQVYSSK